uniref:CSON009369 protein n=1 Tax=Culicoides sonorensis TaxID=179676 RepID=A0A336N8Z0_CULSO
MCISNTITAKFKYQELVKHFEGVGDCLKKTHFHKGSALSFAASQIKNNIKSVSDYIPSNTSVLVVGKPYYFKDDDKAHIWAEMIYIIDEKDQRLEIVYKEFLAKTYKNIFLKDA